MGRNATLRWRRPGRLAKEMSSAALQPANENAKAFRAQNQPADRCAYFPLSAAGIRVVSGMSAPSPKRENLLLNLACNLAIPTFVLMQLSKDKWLGPQWGMIVALIFPLGYGIYDLVQRKKTNIFSVIGVLSVLLTGTLNQMQADGFWFAVKEAAIPTALWRRRAVLDAHETPARPRVALERPNHRHRDGSKLRSTERDRRGDLDQLLNRASYGLAFSFLLSAILNFGLARYLLKSPPGTPEFNAELGKMNGLSLPVIMLPTMVVTMVVLWKLMSGLTQITGLELDDIVRGGAAKQKT